MKTIIKASLFVVFILTLSSCALQPIVSQYDYQQYKDEKVDIAKLGNGKVLIYNGADGLHKVDNTARLNMWIDGKPMGQVRASEYAIMELAKGSYEFNLLHVDLFRFKSTHRVLVDEKTKVIRIEPTFSSNDLNVTNQLPSRFDKFRYVLKRK